MDEERMMEDPSEDRSEAAIREAIRAGAPTFTGRPESLDPDAIMARARRAGEEELALVRSLKRVAALAAMLTLASGLAIGWGMAGPAPDASAQTSIQAVAASSSSSAWHEQMIDEDNSIFLILGSR